MNPRIKKDFELNACGIRQKTSVLPVLLMCDEFKAIVTESQKGISGVSDFELKRNDERIDRKKRFVV